MSSRILRTLMRNRNGHMGARTAVRQAIQRGPTRMATLMEDADEVEEEDDEEEEVSPQQESKPAEETVTSSPTLSQTTLKVSDTASDRNSSKTSSTLLPSKTTIIRKTPDEELVDNPMPVNPWCARCKPVKYDGVLPLKPEEIKLCSIEKLKMLDQMLQGSTSEVNSFGEDSSDDETGTTLDGSRSMALSRSKSRKVRPSVSQHASKMTFRDTALMKAQQRRASIAAREPRLKTFAARMIETINHPTAFSELTVSSIDELDLLPALPRSKFSRELYSTAVEEDGKQVPLVTSRTLENLKAWSPQYAQSRFSLLTSVNQLPLPSRAKPSHTEIPPVFSGFTVEEVSRLERFIQNHVKQQYINKCAAANAKIPRDEKRQANVMKFGAVSQLVSSYQEEKGITSEEKGFLLFRLKMLPLLSDVPSDLLEPIAKTLQSKTFSRGAPIFHQGTEANSIFFVLDGEVEITSEVSESLDNDMAKEGPCVLLPEDVLQMELQKSRPFLPRKNGTRSRTAFASRRHDAQDCATVLVMPQEAIDIVSKHYREIEAADRAELVTNFFARTLRVQSQVCRKFNDVFDVQLFSVGHVLLQEGSQPALEEAMLYLIIEGECNIHCLKRRNGKLVRGAKGTHELCDRGKFLGDSALFGERYPHSVLATKDTKVISIKAVDYLFKILGRTQLFERPAGQKAAGDSDDSEEEAKSRKAFREQAWLSAKKTARLSQDIKTLEEVEWKAIGARDKFPKSKLPGLASQQPSTNSTEVKSSALRCSSAATTVPTGSRLGSSFEECQSWPASSPDYFLAMNWASSGPFGSGLAMHSLDTRVCRQIDSLERIEAEHRSHTVFGYHVEDASGVKLPIKPMITPIPGSIVLLSCGSISHSAPASRSGRRTS